MNDLLYADILSVSEVKPPTGYAVGVTPPPPAGGVRLCRLSMNELQHGVHG